MTGYEMTLWLGCGALAAGILGSLTGLGGGIVIVPFMTLVLDIDIHYALGTSLIAVIATSSGAGANYLRDGYANLKIASFLEVATVLGALFGASLATQTHPSFLGIIFGFALLFSAYFSFRSPHLSNNTIDDGGITEWLQMNGNYPTSQGSQAYFVKNAPFGFIMMIGAGLLSGLLGIGSGAFKVIAMDQIMKIPFKVSTATSNLMIGVTAAAGAGVFLSRGYIDPGLTMPVMLGVVAGSLVGSKILHRAPAATLRAVFAVVITLIGIQMLHKGLTEKF